MDASRLGTGEYAYYPYTKVTSTTQSLFGNSLASFYAEDNANIQKFRGCVGKVAMTKKDIRIWTQKMQRSPVQGVTGVPPKVETGPVTK